MKNVQVTDRKDSFRNLIKCCQKSVIDLAVGLNLLVIEVFFNE